MARSGSDAATAVTENSATSTEAAPMNEVAANPTKAQQASAGVAPEAPAPDARALAREDAEWREKHPDEVRMRDAVEGVGGESFAYLDKVDQPDSGLTSEEDKAAAKKAAAAARADDKWREENPGRLRARKAKAGVGGESFAYLDAVDQGVHPDNLPSDPDDEDD